MGVRDFPTGELDDAVLIVAHPDDEILWFGSIVADVGKIVICFLDDPSVPQLTEARLRTLQNHPLAARIHCLELVETCAFDQADWKDPKPSPFGLRITGAPEISRTYEKRATELKTALAPFVADASHVFTHNPWGEYGHEEHVMVHRVVSDLAESGKAIVWYSNYASSWSVNLMLRYFGRKENLFFRRSVDRESMKQMSSVYRRNETWTWFEDYEWFESEYFVRGPLEYAPESGFGWIFPVNFIEIPDRLVRTPPPLLKRLRRKLRRLVVRDAERVRD